MKPGDLVRVIRANLPTLLSADMSDFHAFNPALLVVWQKRAGRACLRWPDGYTAWFDADAIAKATEGGAS